MRRSLVIVAVVAALAGGAATALAAVVWPSTATTWSGVNSHLNALHNTDLTQFSQVKVVKAVLQQSGGNSENNNVHCPVGWVATGGGVWAAITSDDGDWYINSSGPTFPMGPVQTVPNGWAGSVSAPNYTPGTPLPTDIVVYAICAT